MTRRPDWPERLQQTIQAATVRPFSWRAWNCGLFMAACIESMGGPRWGWEQWQGDPEVTMDALLPASQPAIARRGDPVLADLPNPTLGICAGTEALFLCRRGLLSVPLLECRRAWRFA